MPSFALLATLLWLFPAYFTKPTLEIFTFSKQCWCKSQAPFSLYQSLPHRAAAHQCVCPDTQISENHRIREHKVGWTSGIIWSNFSWQKHSPDKVAQHPAQHHRSVQHWGNHHLPGEIIPMHYSHCEKMSLCPAGRSNLFSYLLPFPHNSLEKGSLHLLCSHPLNNGAWNKPHFTAFSFRLRQKHSTARKATAHSKSHSNLLEHGSKFFSVFTIGTSDSFQMAFLIAKCWQV